MKGQDLQLQDLRFEGEPLPFLFRQQFPLHSEDIQQSIDRKGYTRCR